jgi:hypothetical protein
VRRPVQSVFDILTINDNPGFRPGGGELFNDGRESRNMPRRWDLVGSVGAKSSVRPLSTASTEEQLRGGCSQTAPCISLLQFVGVQALPSAFPLNQ